MTHHEIIDIWNDLVWIRLKFFNKPRIRNNEVLTAINDSVARGIISESDLYTRGLIFDSLCEGHSNTEFQQVIQQLKDQPWFDLSRCWWVHNTQDQIDSRLKTISWPWHMIDHHGYLSHIEQLDIDWEQIRPEKVFVTLMRDPRPWRARLARAVMDRFDKDDYHLGYGSILREPRYDPILERTIPILLDGATPDDSGITHQVVDHRILSCLVNLVVETSREFDLDSSWSSTFITEKTFKPFAWRQMPIFWALPGHADRVRDLGFDVFDDWFDSHSYDKIADPDDRQEAMLQVLEIVVPEIKRHGAHQVRKSIYKRLDKNYQRLLYWKSRYWPQWGDTIKQCQIA